ncbi:MAG: hypothetical protein S4CHLAM81_15220 [Chlamydiales bacterium]|nr:hypothetical protein [Chlamydiales bacterium]MCH9636291.1 hypothetical protein [Chlamydiales bacterium]
MKRSFSLLEVLLSFTLTLLLVGSLSFCYHRMATRRGQMEKGMWPKVEKRYCHQRLDKLFGSVGAPFFTSDQRLPNLSKGSLVFTFDRGIGQDPALSGEVVGRLYHDPQTKRLCLGVWPMEGQEPSETYILLSDVTKLSFRFYQPPVDMEHSFWSDSWTSSHLPALMRIEGVHEGEPFIFAFDLGSAISYCGGRV